MIAIALERILSSTALALVDWRETISSGLTRSSRCVCSHFEYIRSFRVMAARSPRRLPLRSMLDRLGLEISQRKLSLLAPRIAISEGDFSPHCRAAFAIWAARASSHANIASGTWAERSHVAMDSTSALSHSGSVESWAWLRLMGCSVSKVR